MWKKIEKSRDGLVDKYAGIRGLFNSGGAKKVGRDRPAGRG
jgi:hypothetical protein